LIIARRTGATGLDRDEFVVADIVLVLGAIGVAMAMRAHLQQRLDTIAIMKSLGARSGQVIKIYLLQTLLLGAAGGVLGVALGVGVQLSFPYLLAKLIHVDTELHVQLSTVVTGLAVGILTTLLFTLPPLLDIRGVRPILILRRAVDDNDPFAAVSAQDYETLLSRSGIADPQGLRRLPVR
jgi:putative ABC transport system permease protein